MQDTLERACSKWRLWAPGSDLRAWLLTLMHNVYLNQRRGPVMVAVDIDDPANEIAAAPARTDEALDLSRCLQRLPAEQRAVLLLVSMEDLSYAEAARVLGLPIGTVMSRLSRARSRLRELMDGADIATDTTPVMAPAAAPMLRRLK